MAATAGMMATMADIMVSVIAIAVVVVWRAIATLQASAAVAPATYQRDDVGWIYGLLDDFLYRRGLSRCRLSGAKILNLALE